MENEAPSPSTHGAHTRLLSGVVILLSLAVLAGTVVYGALELRAKTRGQILQHHADMLYQVARLEQSQRAELGLIGEEIEDVTDQFMVLLEVSKLSGVVATRQFDTAGLFLQAFPVGVREKFLPPGMLSPLIDQRRPVAEFRTDSTLDAILNLTDRPDMAMEGPVPVLSVTIPLHDEAEGPVVGLGQFLIDGTGLAAEFDRLDRNLWQQAATVFAVGGLLLVGVLTLAFRWLIRTNHLLMERTRHLRKANRELSLAARTSALGAITAYLVHGISSPLTGLNEFVGNRRSHNEEDDELRDALASTRRMQALVQDVVRVISEAQEDSQYEVSLADLRAQLEDKLKELQKATRVDVAWSLPNQGSLSNRQADLLRFILENLIQNALQATPAGQRVAVRFQRSGAAWLFEVEDQGPGVPESMRSKIFRPGHSTKAGGSGIGLAISRQLATHLGATLELVRTGQSGSLFSVRLPHPPTAPDRRVLMAHTGSS